MSKKATKFQRKAMSKMYRGKEIFKPLNTGWTDNFEFYDESDDTEKMAKSGFLKGVGR